MRLIDVDDYCQNICRCNKDMCERDKCTIRTAKTVDVVPVVHGKWVNRKMDEVAHPLRCCICGWGKLSINTYVANFRYCPQCGAKMDLEGTQK